MYGTTLPANFSMVVSFSDLTISRLLALMIGSSALSAVTMRLTAASTILLKEVLTVSLSVSISAFSWLPLPSALSTIMSITPPIRASLLSVTVLVNMDMASPPT